MKRCALFLDTNIYLHYTFFTEVAWDKVVGSTGRKNRIVSDSALYSLTIHTLLFSSH